MYTGNQIICLWKFIVPEYWLLREEEIKSEFTVDICTSIMCLINLPVANTMPLNTELWKKWKASFLKPYEQACIHSWFYFTNGYTSQWPRKPDLKWQGLDSYGIYPRTVTCLSLACGNIYQTQFQSASLFPVHVLIFSWCCFCVENMGISL